MRISVRIRFVVSILILSFALGILVPEIAVASQLENLMRGLVNKSQPSGRTRVYTSELSSREAQRVQQALRTLGYYDGGIDGVIGPGTFAAVARWANANGWDAPNTLRAAHLQALEAEVNRRQKNGKQPSSTIDTKIDIEVIKRVQTALNALGYLKGKADGVAGAGTLEAMARWASDRGWTAPSEIRNAHAENMEQEIRSRGISVLNVAEKTADPRTVKRVQNALATLGYFSGTIDGTPNTATMDAMSRWAADRGWDAPSEIRTAHADYMESELAGNATRVSNTGLLSQLASWRDNDTVDGYFSRLRKSVRDQGGECSAEREAMEAYATGFSTSWETSPNLRVGQSDNLLWQASTGTNRLPIWLIVSSKTPLRFSGKGHLALGPDSHNPLGLRAGLGQARAVVPLHAAESGMRGAIAWESLKSGPVALSVQLVGYLRACESEVVLVRKEKTFEILPAPATVVLDTPLGRALYEYQVDLASHARRLLFNDKGVLILDSSTDTEIARHGGLDMSVSPTHRFLTLRQGETLNVIDVVDGSIVAEMHDGAATYWGLGDSLVMTTRSPWVKVSLESTFGEMLSVDDITTGSACCMAEPDGSTRVVVDLTNAAFLIEGGQGTLGGSLIDAPEVGDESKAGGYAGGGAKDGPQKLRNLLLRSGISPFSSGAKAHDLVEGLKLTAIYSDNAYWEDTQITRSFKDAVTLRLSRVGLSQHPRTSLSAEVHANPLEFHFERLGVSLRKLSVGEQVFSGKVSSYAGDLKARLEESADVMMRFEKESKSAGWRYEWALPTPEEMEFADCYHVVMESGLVPEGALAPRDVVEVHRIETSTGSIWLARGECTAGATYGSLREYNALFLMDLGRPQPSTSNGSMLDGTFFFENNQPEDMWFQHPFKTKADDRFLLTYAPGEGVISVFDRNARKMLWIGVDLSDGNLLADAFLTQDAKHAVQLNADGSFRIYSLANGMQLLEGRLVDDEIAVWTADYHYDATAEAASLIDIRFPGKLGTYSLDRFGSARAVSGLMATVLDKAEFPSGKPLQIPPELDGQISLIDGGEIKLNLMFDATDVNTISVFQDGILSDSLREEEIEDPALTIRRLPGSRWVTAIAANEDGLASRAVSADLGPPDQGTQKRFLAIGINNYQYGLDALDFPLRDAGTLLNLFGRSGEDKASGYKVHGLKNDGATPDAIMAATSKSLDGLGKSDSFILFFAGHAVGQDGKLYLATTGTNPNNLRDTALPFDELLPILAESSARITVLLDACHTGLAGQDLFVSNDELASGFEKLPSNVTIVAAAKGRQTSIGSAAAGGGYFTQAIAQIAGEKRNTFDLNGNSAIEVDELLFGLRKLVGDASNGEQSPWIVNSRMVGPYAVF